MICIIPQHAKSVRFPRKAFQKIGDYSIIEWAVIQSVTAHGIDEVYVSTESEEIAGLVEPLGAKIIWRPPEIQDKAFAANVPIDHAIRHLGLADKHVPFVSRLASGPLLLPGDIDRMIDMWNGIEDPPPGINKIASLAAETQEGFIHKRMPWKEKAGRTIMLDKSHETILPIGVMAIQYTDDYVTMNIRAKWLHKSDGINDKDIDADPMFHAAMIGSGVFYYAPCQQWQCADIDDEQGYDLCKKLMETYILNGNGAEIYYEYARNR